MGIKEEVLKMKAISPRMASSTAAERNGALEQVKGMLLAKKAEIFAANKKDLDYAKENGISEAIIKRLKFDDGKLEDVIKGIDMLIGLTDPLGKVTLDRQLDSGLELVRISCPIGVIGVIFEARPDALVQISTLCIKSGNCAILKGGKETQNTNRSLFDVIHSAAVAAGLPEKAMLLAETHDEIDALLECHGQIDLLIPRGSNAFVQYIMNNTKIPVMGHADGVCHIYVDAAADKEKLIPIIVDAKTQYTAACNAVETLLVNRSVAKELLPDICEALKAAGVKINGTAEAAQICPDINVIGEDDFKEYLALEISVKLVDGVDEAIDHINLHGSHHTDAIITEDDAVADKFFAMVDSAGVYRNCSTRFADGFRYGFGAEVGISTSKIHARGPVGLDGLVTYKYRLTGDGHIVGDYASGKRQFNFKEIL